MPDIVVNDRLVIPDAEVAVAFTRASGPGGQNVNKVASKVELRWRPDTSAVLSEYQRAWLLRRLGTRLTSAGELIVTSSLTRDQGRNREDAAAKLAAIVRAALERPTPRRPTRPTRASRERRLNDKRRRSERKQNRRGRYDD